MSINEPFPYLPSRSTSLYLDGFDPAAFNTDPKTWLYRYLDAMVGTSGGGAGTLINQIFLSNMSSAIDTCYFNELDYIVGNINFLARTTAESYSYDPQVDQLTSDQWDEVRIKDAWFRSRIKEFFQACQLGGTPEGIRKCVSAAIAADCTIQEVYRYSENFIWVDPDHTTLGRTEAKPLGTPSGYYSVTNLQTGFQVLFAGTGALSAANAFRDAQTDDWEVEVVSPRNEVVIVPHKKSVSQAEIRLLREMLSRLLPIDTVITVDTEGLSLSVPVRIASASADSTYFEVIKQVEPGPLVEQLPAPEYLPIDLLPSEQWLLNDPPKNAPRWKPNHAYHVGDVVKHVGNFYYCVTEGTSAHFKGPVGKGSPLIIDGTVTWREHEKAHKEKGLFSTIIEAIAGNSNKREAPYSAFVQSSQYSYCYLTGGGTSSSIDSTSYGTLQSDGSVKSEKNHQLYQDKSSYTEWMQYQKADSPDNFPGGQFGKHPSSSPAVNPDGTQYRFSYPSQSAYVTDMIEKVQAMGGIADTSHYKLPINKNQMVVYTYYPEYAVSSSAPVKESSISSSITRQRPRTLANNLGSPNNFVR